MAPLCTPGRTKTVWLVLWLALAAMLVVRATRRPEARGVILDHLEFGRRLLHGEDVHGPWRSDPDAPVRPLHAPYPPSFGLLTAPFSLVADTLGIRAARAAWALLQVGCLAAAALVLRRRLQPRAPPDARPSYWHLLWLGTFVLGSRFVLRDTHGGGGNLVNLALCLLAFDDAERGRHRRAGLWLGLSLATKPTQVWLVLAFLAFGRFRAVGWTIATGAVAVFVTLLLQRFDLAPWLRWLEGTWCFSTQADPFAVPAFEFPQFEWMNQSLRCALARWFGDVPPQFAAKVTLGLPDGLGLGIGTVAWITRLASLWLLGWLLVAVWRARATAGARLQVFAAALVLSVLLSPLSWKAHHVALLPLVFLLLQHAVAHRSRGTWLLLALWAAVCCLPGQDLVGEAIEEWLNSAYVITFWDIVLFATALTMARSAARTADFRAADSP